MNECYCLTLPTAAECNKLCQAVGWKRNENIHKWLLPRILTCSFTFRSLEISVQYLNTQHHLEFGMILHSVDQQITA